MFAVLFENTILDIVPASLFLLLAPFRIYQLVRRRSCVRTSLLYHVKLVWFISPTVSVTVILTTAKVTAVAFFVLQVLILGLGSTPKERSATSIAAHVLDVLAAVAVAVLTHFEHIKSIRPSFLISFYLASTALLDTARVRTAWLLPSNSAAATALTVSLAVKVLLVGLETTEKRQWLSVPEKGISLESTSGPFNRGFFVWLNNLLRRGYSSFLTPDALPISHEGLKSAALAERFQYAWDHGKSSIFFSFSLPFISVYPWFAF